MKKNFLKFMLPFVLILAFTFSCSVLVDDVGKGVGKKTESNLSRASYDINRPPSQLPPGGLLPQQVPQFIVIGYDDNQFADGMNNILNVYKGLTNPVGSGNPATYDGTPAKASFYMNPAGRDIPTGETWQVNADTVNSWKNAYAQGHEIGNHTWFHEHGLQFSKARWIEEISKTHDFIISRLGVAPADLTGFRTPFLEYNTSTFLALKELGYEYDNSFEGGWRYWPAEDGSTLFYPYTMDNGRPFNEDGRDFGIVPGFWEVPTDCLFFPGGRTTGFDYNLWFSKRTTKKEFIDILKYSLLKKYNGNRSPMNFGAHTNYYSDTALEEMKIYDPDSVFKLRTTVAERTTAIKEFLEYALTLPDVRIVTTQQVLEWQKNPVGLNLNPVTYKVTAVSGANGRVTPESVEVEKGADVLFTIAPDAGYTIGAATFNGEPVAIPGNTYLAKNLQADSVFEVQFNRGGDYIDVITSSGPNGAITPSQKVPFGSTVEIFFYPDSGYVVDEVIVNGVPVAIGDDPSILILSVTEHMTIHVTFAPVGPPPVVVTYIPGIDWGTGFDATVEIKNNSSNTIDSWEVILTYNGNQMITGWNGIFSQSGQVVTVKNTNWNGIIQPGKAVSFGLNGSYSGANNPPVVQIR